jgi:hypothetical protein
MDRSAVRRHSLRGVVGAIRREADGGEAEANT